MPYKEGEDYFQYNHPSVLKNQASVSHDSFQKRTRIFVGGLGPREVRKQSRSLIVGSPPPFAVIPGDAAGDDAAGNDVAEDNSEDSDSDASDSDGSDSDDSAEGSVTSEPSAENLAAGPLAAGSSTVGEWGSRANRHGHRRSTTLNQPHQKRMPFFVTSMMARRRPAMRRRRSSKNAVGPGPSKLRSEVHFDSEDASKDSKQGQPRPQSQVKDAEVENKFVDQSKPVEENKEEYCEPEQKETESKEKLQGMSQRHN